MGRPNCARRSRLTDEKTKRTLLEVRFEFCRGILCLIVSFSVLRGSVSAGRAIGRSGGSSPAGRLFHLLDRTPEVVAHPGLEIVGESVAVDEETVSRALGRHDRRLREWRPFLHVGLNAKDEHRRSA